MRLKNGMKNIIFEFIYSFVVIVINFIIRREIIKLIGIELVGLNSLLNQIIALMSLAELGISSVMTYHLYKPLENKNEKRIIQLMNLFKKMYHFVCLFIIVIGLIFMPFLKYFIKDYTLSINYYFVYILFLIQTAFTYLFSYKMILMKADQKEYKYRKILIIFKIITFIIELAFLHKNYYIYLILNIFDTLLINFIIAKYISKNYQFLDKKYVLNKKEKNEIKKDIKNTFICRISWIITTSSDTVILSLLSNVTVLGLYSNYYIIVNTIYTIADKFFSAIQSSVGTSIVNKNNSEIKEVYNNLSFVSFIFAIFASIMFYIFINFVISIWVGKEYILSNMISICFTLQLFVMIYRTNLWHFISISGMFAVDKMTAIIGSIANIILSVILYLYIGMSGLILGTVASQLIQYVIKRYYISKKFEFKIKDLKGITIFAIIFIVDIILTKYINNFILGFTNIIVISLILIIFYKNTSEFKYLKNTISLILKK